MRRCSGELDQLMWSLVDGDDVDAMNAFNERYPELREELARRTRMMRRLRAARPPRRERPPRFEPLVVSPAAARPPRLVPVAVGAAAIFAVGFASYAVVANLSQETERQSVSIAASVTSPPADETNLRAVEVPIERHGEVSPMASRDGGDEPSASPAPIGTSRAPIVSIAFEDEPIDDALERLADAARLRLLIAPGFPATKITARYDAAEGKTILADLAARYGFTAFDQGDGSYLVIPAVDPRVAEGRDAPAHRSPN